MERTATNSIDLADAVVGPMRKRSSLKAYNRVRRRSKHLLVLIILAMFACKSAIAAMHGPFHSDAFPLLLILGVALLASAVVLLYVFFDRRRKAEIHALLAKCCCLNCEANLAADAKRCPVCGLDLDEQDRIRRNYEHFCAPGAHIVARAERRHAVFGSIFLLFWLGVLVATAIYVKPWIDALRHWAPAGEAIQAVVVTVAAITFFLVPAFLVYNRSQRRTRRLLLPIKDRCINCGGRIEGLPDDAFCPRCNASLLKRRYYLRAYKLDRK